MNKLQSKVEELKKALAYNLLSFTLLNNFLFLVDGEKVFFSSFHNGFVIFHRRYSNDRTGFAIKYDELLRIVSNGLVGTYDNLIKSTVTIYAPYGTTPLEDKEMYFVFDDSVKEPTYSRETIAVDQPKCEEKTETDQPKQSEPKKEKKKAMNKYVKQLVKEVSEEKLTRETLKHFVICTTKTKYTFSRLEKSENNTHNLIFTAEMKNKRVGLRLTMEDLKKIIEDSSISTVSEKKAIHITYKGAKNWFFMYDASVVKAETLEKARAAKEEKRKAALEEKAQKEKEEKIKRENEEREFNNNLLKKISEIQITSFIELLVALFLDKLNATIKTIPHAYTSVSRLLVLYNDIKNDKDEKSLQKLKGILHSHNAGSKAVFEQICGYKLPRTDKGTRQVLDAIFNDDLDFLSTLSVAKKIEPKQAKKSKKKTKNKEYIIVEGNQIIEVDATKFECQEISRELFITKYDNAYSITDKKTGMRIIASKRTKKELLAYFETQKERVVNAFNTTDLSNQEYRFEMALKEYKEKNNIVDDVEENSAEKIQEQATTEECTENTTATTVEVSVDDNQRKTTSADQQEPSQEIDMTTVENNPKHNCNKEKISENSRSIDDANSVTRELSSVDLDSKLLFKQFLATKNTRNYTSYRGKIIKDFVIYNSSLFKYKLRYKHLTCNCSHSKRHSVSKKKSMKKNLLIVESSMDYP